MGGEKSLDDFYTAGHDHRLLPKNDPANERYEISTISLSVQEDILTNRQFKRNLPPDDRPPSPELQNTTPRALQTSPQNTPMT